MKQRNLQYTGWTLFVISAIFFILTSSSAYEMIASLAFLFGCIVFVASILIFGR